jgi:hypothetical protein
LTELHISKLGFDLIRQDRGNTFLPLKKQCCGSGFAQGNADTDPGGNKDPQKKRKVKKCIVLKVLDVLFLRLEVFSVSLDILHGA